MCPFISHIDTGMCSASTSGLRNSFWTVAMNTRDSEQIENVTVRNICIYVMVLLSAKGEGVKGVHLHKRWSIWFWTVSLIKIVTNTEVKQNYNASELGLCLCRSSCCHFSPWAWVNGRILHFSGVLIQAHHAFAEMNLLFPESWKFADVGTFQYML